MITDFGIAKVIGGNFNVLATDVYKQVIGQQNFSMGAVVGMVLLAPAALAFVVDRFVQRKQVALLTARAVPLIPKPKFGRDVFFTAFCTVISLGILAILGMAAWGSLIKYWPYNLSLTLANYQFANFDANGWDSYFNSLRMAAGAAVFGTALMFVGAWLTRRPRASARCAASCSCWPSCPWRCPAWCWAWATSSSSTRPATRSTSSTPPWRSW